MSGREVREYTNLTDPKGWWFLTIVSHKFLPFCLLGILIGLSLTIFVSVAYIRR
jgi:hypothetical protein